MRDRVLDKAQLASTDTLLDVGCGDGLIGFGALERLGSRGRVIFSDISADLLDRCREIASGIGTIERCDFLQSSADDLASVPDVSVDVVTTRSVLIYVADKSRALCEFYRVLRKGGRISLFEPINRFTLPEPPGFFYGYDLRPIANLVAKVRAVYDSLQTAQNPMFDFDERDLLRFVEEAGFTEAHLEYRVDIEPRAPDDPERFLHTAGNPLVPTLAEAMDQSLSADERQRFRSSLHPLVEHGKGTRRLAVALLSAVKRPRLL
jgi:ubiquinone/menaquinone biosynthesis C-methylase UbiE